jgi:hypothetical protein
MEPISSDASMSSVFPRTGSRSARRGGAGGWARASTMLGATPRVTASLFTPFDALFSHPEAGESSSVDTMDRTYMF